MIKFAFTFERICFMKFAFDKCEFFLASSHPYLLTVLMWLENQSSTFMITFTNYWQRQSQFIQTQKVRYNKYVLFFTVYKHNELQKIKLATVCWSCNSTSGLCRHRWLLLSSQCRHLANMQSHYLLAVFNLCSTVGTCWTSQWDCISNYSRHIAGGGEFPLEILHSPPPEIWQREKFGQLILTRIVEIVATRCQILRLKCTKFGFGWGSPDP